MTGDAIKLWKNVSHNYVLQIQDSNNHIMQSLNYVVDLTVQWARSKVSAHTFVKYFTHDRNNSLLVSRLYLSYSAHRVDHGD